MMLLIGVIVLAVLVRLVPLWGAVLGAAASMTLPYSYILHRRDKRFRKFRENFPDVLDSLARALRAGYPLSSAMDMIAAETSPPVSAENAAAHRPRRTWAALAARPRQLREAYAAAGGEPLHRGGAITRAHRGQTPVK